MADEIASHSLLRIEPVALKHRVEESPLLPTGKIVSLFSLSFIQSSPADLSLMYLMIDVLVDRYFCATVKPCLRE